MFAEVVFVQGEVTKRDSQHQQLSADQAVNKHDFILPVECY